MHPRIAAFLLGCLLSGSLFLMFVATQNFRTVDRLLASPPPVAQQAVRALGQARSDTFLRYFAGTENQLFFNTWEVAELLLSSALAVVLFSAARRLLTGLAAGLVVLAALQHFLITPAMIALGRSLDVQASPPDQFWKLHALYGVIEVIKLLSLVIMGVLLLTDWRLHGRKSTNERESSYARFS